MFIQEYLVELRRRRYTPAAFAWYIWKSILRARANLYRNPDGARSVVVNALGFYGAFLAFALFLAIFRDGALARRFIVVESWAVGIGGLWMLTHLSLLRDRSGIPQGRIGLPNQLSFLRLLLVPAVYVFLVRSDYLLAFTAYVLAGASDILDGRIARRLHLETRLGLVLDPIVDVAYIVSIFTALHRTGLIPSWLHALVIARYVLQILGVIVLYVIRTRLEIRPTGYGRLSGVLMASINLFLMGMAAFGWFANNPDVRDVLHAGLGFLFVIACVQLVVIGLHNLHGGDERTVAYTKVAGRVGQGDGR